MKKFLTLKNIILCSGVLLLLVAFFLSFAAGLKLNEAGGEATFKNIIWGCKKVVSSDGEEVSIAVIFGEQKVGPAVLPFVGVLLMVLSAVGAVLVALLVNKPWAKWVVIGCAAFAVAGAVFQFFAYPQFLRAGINAMAKHAGITDKDEINHAYDMYKSHWDKMNPRTVVSIVMGALGIAGGLAVGASQFLPEKK